jgi:acetyltransferase-like isoleucine patch superfamily enzyme
MIGQRLRLAFDFVRALPAEIVATRRAIAYRWYLATRYPSVDFGQNSMVRDDCEFEKGVYIGYGTGLSNCKMGRYSYIAANGKIHNSVIGAFCSLGPELFVGLGIHPLDYVSTYPGIYAPQQTGCRTSFTNIKYQPFEEFLPVIIGSDVWIGARVTIRDGVRVGHGAVIGAGAMVAADVEPYSIVGGVPARLIRKRFSDDIITRLLALRWWEKPLEWIDRHAIEFADPQSFLDQVAVEVAGR